MQDFNIIIFLWDFFDVLGNFATLLYNFLFSPITIGTFTFTPILAIGGGVIITLITIKLIKEFV